MEAEVASLQAIGVTPSISKRGGQLRMEFGFPSPEGGKDIWLSVVYPDAYPYFRFEVVAAGESFARHQNPLHKNLCLLRRESGAWEIGDTIGSVLAEQLRKIVHTATPEKATKYAAEEDAQAEPISVYYPYSPGSILVSSEWVIPTGIASGSMTIGIAEPRGRTGTNGLLPSFQGAVLEMAGEDGAVIASATDEIRRFYRKHVVKSRWLRLGAAPLVSDPAQLAELARARDPRARENEGGQIGGLNARLWAILFPEEHSARDATGLGWLFVAQLTGSLIPKQQMSPAAHAQIRGLQPRR